MTLLPPSTIDQIRKLLVGLKMARSLARISHQNRCIGLANLR